MATSPDSLVWRNVETDDIPASALGLYNQYKTAQRSAAAAREAFETEFSIILGFTPNTTQRLVFGYKFGKLSIAVAPNDKPKPTTKRAATSLADFLTSHAAVRSI